MKYLLLIALTLTACTQKIPPPYGTDTVTSTATSTATETAKTPEWKYSVANPKFLPAWKDATLKALEELGPNLLNKVPADAEKFYPGFSRLDHEGRKAFWLMFISSLIQYESNYDPATTYQESFKDNAGANVISRGLLQISVESGNGSYYRCGVTTTSLHDPVTNLRCGVKIMNYWMGRDGVITSKSGDTWLGIARYWGPMRKDEKVSAIALKTRAI